MTITTSSATRTNCLTCVPTTYTYSVRVAGTFATVSTSVFTTVTSTAITINTNSPQTNTNFVFRATDTSISPSSELVLDAPFTVVWANACSLTTFDATTFTVAQMTTYVTSPTNPVVTQLKTFKDTASTTYGNNDGFTLCSPRTYIFSGPTQASLLSYDAAA